METKWSTYEANVQSYRSNMIASQSFLLAVGAIVVDQDSMILELICIVIALIQLWFIWYRVIRVRTIISDFYKFNLEQKFNDCGCQIVGACDNRLDEDTYLKNRFIRKKVNQRLAIIEQKPKLKHNMRYSRVKIDLLLPVSFSIIWIAFLFYSLKII